MLVAYGCRGHQSNTPDVVIPAGTSRPRATSIPVVQYGHHVTHDEPSPPLLWNGFQQVVREPNGSVHSFDQCWTSIAEDPFLSLPHAAATPTTEDASPLDATQTNLLNACKSSSYPSLQSEAPQPDYDTSNGLDAQSEAELSFGLHLYGKSPNPDSESSVPYGIDLDYHFDHNSQPSFAFSDPPITTPHNESPSAGLTSSEMSNVSETLSPSLSPPFDTNSSFSNTLSWDTQKQCTPPTHLQSANDHQPGRLALPPAPTWRCRKCLRAFASKARLEKHAPVHTKFNCDIEGCGKSFTAHRELRRHQGTIHACNITTPPLSLACAEIGCSYNTRRKDNLKRHHMTRHVQKLAKDS
ncbi:hypothetical protein BDR22DRAFT_967952 [Usnea florida]